MSLDRDAERTTLVGLRARDREAADAALALDLDAELHVLARPEARPRSVGTKDHGAGVAGLAADLDDARPNVLGGQHRMDVLEVVIDAVGGSQGRDGTRGECLANQAHRVTSRKSVNMRTLKVCPT